MEEKKIKNFRTWMILDYKTGRFRLIKRKNKLKPSEIAIDVSLNVEVPEEPIMKAEGNIVLSAPKLADMTLEELEG